MMSLQIKLLDALDKYFNENELMEVCFELGIDYENLAATSKRRKAMELIGFLERLGRTSELIRICQRLRPNARAAFDVPSDSPNTSDPNAGGGEVVSRQKPIPEATTPRQNLQQALDMSRRSLAILEAQAAGYTSLTIPTHLSLELEDKRKEVADLERRLNPS